MIRATARPIGALLPALLLCACAASGDYPSLAIRNAERVQGSATPAAGTTEAPPSLPPASADLTTRIASLLGTARKAHAGFQSRQAATERAVSGAGGIATPAWSTAQVALSGLQTERSGVLTALAELDRLYADARLANPEQVSPSAAAIAEARDQVQEWAQSEDATISRLDSRLRN